MLFGIDILFWLFTIIIDNIFYKNGFFPRMFLEYFFVIIISIAIAVLLLLRRKIFCIIGGYSYLICGILGWIIRVIYICYLVFGNQVKNYYEVNYSKYYFNFIIFLIHIVLIFVRLYCCYLIKVMYKSLGFFERYSREKEHAEFIEKLGNKMGDDKKMIQTVIQMIFVKSNFVKKITQMNIMKIKFNECYIQLSFKKNYIII